MDDPSRATRFGQDSNPQRESLGGSLRGLLSWHSLAPSALLLLVLWLSLGGCGQKKVQTEALGSGLDSSYKMLTREVDMLVSDSGLVKYRLISPMWLVYDRHDRHEWLFPEGVRLESYDTLVPSKTLVVADHASYQTEDEIWVLTGNVRLHGLNGERLYTPKLYWERKPRRLYSNDTTYFFTQGKELHGNRFEAVDDLSSYSIYSNRGRMEVEDEPKAAPAPEYGTDHLPTELRDSVCQGL